MNKNTPLYSFNNHIAEAIPLTDSTMTSVRTGLEARYADRFTKYVGTSSESIKRVDEAKKVADELRTSAGVIDTQTENINELFTVAEMAVKTIDNFQRQSGKRQVNNIPLPSESIKTSAGKKLGYVKLCMKFMNAGLLHFMEQSMSLEDEVKERNNVIRAIAGEIRSVPIIGKLQELDLDDLATTDPIIDIKTDVGFTTDEEDEIKPSRSQRDSGVSMGKPPSPVQTKPSSPVVKSKDSKDSKDSKESKKSKK